MRNRLAGLLAGLLAVLGVLTVGSGSASAASSSTEAVDIWFYQNGLYSAYADIWAYDAHDNLIGHPWSGSKIKGDIVTLTVPAGTATISTLVRMDPAGNTIHQQTIHDWWNYSCAGRTERPTMYVGGTAWSPDHYDLHCKKY